MAWYITFCILFCSILLAYAPVWSVFICLLGAWRTLLNMATNVDWVHNEGKMNVKQIHKGSSNRDVCTWPFYCCGWGFRTNRYFYSSCNFAYKMHIRSLHDDSVSLFVMVYLTYYIWIKRMVRIVMSDVMLASIDASLDSITRSLPYLALSLNSGIDCTSTNVALFDTKACDEMWYRFRIRYEKACPHSPQAVSIWLVSQTWDGLVVWLSKTQDCVLKEDSVVDSSRQATSISKVWLILLSWVEESISVRVSMVSRGK